MNDLGLKIAVVVLLLGLRLVRWRRRRLTGFGASWPAMIDNPTDTSILMTAGVVWSTALVFWYGFPQQIASCNVAVPDGLRWAAVAVAAAALGLLGWADATLGENLCVSLKLRTDHTLVTSGPYRWVRHPIYSAALVFFAAVAVVSANWLVGASLIGGMVLIVACGRSTTTPICRVVMPSQ